jgi:LPXTG-motif cell wall-anchored protein
LLNRFEQYDVHPAADHGQNTVAAALNDGFTGVLAGALGLSSPAFAADGDTARLIALTAHDPALNGTSYPIKPGETVPVDAGVANLGDKAVSGLVVHLWFIGSKQRLTDDFSNCQYYLDGTAQGAWCEFDQELAAGGKYALPPLHVSVPAGATETRTLVEVVYSKEYADSRGGMAALAKVESSPAGVTLVPGTGAKAGLAEGTDLTPAKQPAATSFIYFHLILPSASPRPNVSPTSVTATAPAAGGQAGGTGGGGLPVTGGNTAVVAGAGAALLVGGAAVFLLTRRRRARFTA